MWSWFDISNEVGENLLHDLIWYFPHSLLFDKLTFSSSQSIESMNVEECGDTSELLCRNRKEGGCKGMLWCNGNQNRALALNPTVRSFLDEFVTVVCVRCRTVGQQYVTEGSSLRSAFFPWEHCKTFQWIKFTQSLFKSSKNDIQHRTDWFSARKI